MGNVDKFDNEDDEIRTPLTVVNLEHKLHEVPGYGKVGILSYLGEYRLVCNDQKISFSDDEWEAFKPYLKKLFD